MRFQPDRSAFGQIIRYGYSGLISLPANLVVTTALHEAAGLPVEWSAAAGFVVAMTIGFLFCRYSVFDGRDGDPGRQFAAYALSSAVFRGLEYGAFVALFRIAGVQYIAAIVVVQVVSFFVKFAYYKLVVFARPGSRTGGRG